MFLVHGRWIIIIISTCIYTWTLHYLLPIFTRVVYLRVQNAIFLWVVRNFLNTPLSPTLQLFADTPLQVSHIRTHTNILCTYLLLSITHSHSFNFSILKEMLQIFLRAHISIWLPTMRFSLVEYNMCSTFSSLLVHHSFFLQYFYYFCR